MFLKVCVGKQKDGYYKAWSRDDQHRRESEKLGVFRDIWRDRGGPLPWRLTEAELDTLGKMTASLIWPRYIERVHYKGVSFWENTSRIWKCRRKMRLLYFLLPTLMRDVLPAVRHALYVFVWAMRRLQGQVHSYEEALRLEILPGSFAVDKRGIQQAHTDLIRGLVLLEGCLPLSHLNPAMHHFVHYAEYTASHGPLRLHWMMPFERYQTASVRFDHDYI